MQLAERPGFDEPLLRWRVTLPPERARFLKALKDFVMTEVIRSPGVQQLEFKGQSMVIAVFEALLSDPDRLLPRDAQDRFAAAGGRPAHHLRFRGRNDRHLPAEDL